MIKDLIMGNGELRILPNQSSKGSIDDFGQLVSRISNSNWVTINEKSNYHEGIHEVTALGVFVISFKNQIANKVAWTLDNSLIPQVKAHLNDLVDWLSGFYGIFIDTCVDRTIALMDGTPYAIIQLRVGHGSNKDVNTQIRGCMDAIVASIAISADIHCRNFEYGNYNRYREYNISLPIEYVCLNSIYRDCIVPFTPIPVG